MRPHGSVAVGILLEMFCAALLKSAGFTLLPEIPGPVKVICRLLLHAGEAYAVKSPASMAAVGT
jgi:hypothetical protein